MISLIVILLLSPSTFATSNEYETALLDAEETFQQYQKSVAELIDSINDSPAKFESRRKSLEYDLDQYCDSMKKFSPIHKNCIAQKQLSTPILEKRYAHLKSLVKEDEDDYEREFRDIEKFLDRAMALRVIQENGENIHPDVLQEKRMALESEMSKHCPKMTISGFKKHCHLQLERIKIKLANYEYDLRSGAYTDPPVSGRKVYTDRTPIFRCFFQLPNLRDRNLEYKLSDPSGRYRFEYMKKSRFDYAVSIPLAKIETSEINSGFSVRKTFTDPRNSKSYSIYISPVYACAPGIGNPPNCKVNSIGITLSFIEPERLERSARASFPIKKDSSFDFSIPADDIETEGFGILCAIAAKMRTGGGWIYSDEVFDVN